MIASLARNAAAGLAFACSMVTAQTIVLDDSASAVLATNYRASHGLDGRALVAVASEWSGDVRLISSKGVEVLYSTDAEWRAGVGVSWATDTERGQAALFAWLGTEGCLRRWGRRAESDIVTHFPKPFIEIQTKGFRNASWSPLRDRALVAPLGAAFGDAHVMLVEYSGMLGLSTPAEVTPFVLEEGGGCLPLKGVALPYSYSWDYSQSEESLYVLAPGEDELGVGYTPLAVPRVLRFPLDGSPSSLIAEPRSRATSLALSPDESMLLAELRYRDASGLSTKPLSEMSPAEARALVEQHGGGFSIIDVESGRARRYAVGARMPVWLGDKRVAAERDGRVICVDVATGRCVDLLCLEQEDAGWRVERLFSCLTGYAVLLSDPEAVNDYSALIVDEVVGEYWFIDGVSGNHIDIEIFSRGDF